jgi:hypothetical protein
MEIVDYLYCSAKVILSRKSTLSGRRGSFTTGDFDRHGFIGRSAALLVVITERDKAIGFGIVRCNPSLGSSG